MKPDDSALMDDIMCNIEKHTNVHVHMLECTTSVSIPHQKCAWGNQTKTCDNQLYSYTTSCMLPTCKMPKKTKGLDKVVQYLITSTVAGVTADRTSLMQLSQRGLLTGCSLTCACLMHACLQAEGSTAECNDSQCAAITDGHSTRAF